MEELVAKAMELELPRVSTRERWMAMKSVTSSFTRPSQSMGSASPLESGPKLPMADGRGKVWEESEEPREADETTMY